MRHPETETVVSTATFVSSSDSAQDGTTKGSFSRNVVGTTIGNLITPLVGIACAPVLVHALGVTGRGHFAATTSPALLLTLAGTLGLPEAVTYFVASGRLPARTALWRASFQSLVMGVALAIGVIAVAPMISAGNGRVATIMGIGALTLPGALVVGALRGVASGQHRWTLVNIERAGGNVLRLGLVVIFAVMGRLGLLEATLIYLISPVAIGVVYLPLAWSAVRGTGPSLSATPEITLLHFGLKSWIGGLAGVVLARLDQVLMTPLSDARQLGFYAAAVSIAEIPYVISAATSDVILAADAATANDRRASQASRLTFVVTLLFALALALASPLLIDVAYGPAFGPATPMLILLLVASVAYTPGLTSGGLLLARGHPISRSVALGGACVLNVILLPVLVPPLGGDGAALASVVAYLLFSVINLVLIRRNSDLTLRDLLVPTRADIEWITAPLVNRIRRDIPEH